MPEQKFNEWLVQVDTGVQANIGVSIYDLPDMPYDDWFDDGFTPQEAVEQVIEELLYDGYSVTPLI